MLHYLQMHKTVLERSDGLLPWIKTWWLTEEKLNQLSPEGWYSEVFEQGNYLWTPPPAASDAALEQLCRNFHLHHCNFHIVCIPRLMTSRWRKQLLKVCDLYVEMPFDETVWSTSNFEPLILAIVFPFCRHYPWKLKRTKFVREAEGNLQRMWPNNLSMGGNILRDFLKSSRSLETLSGSVVREMLQVS